jgi:hypothetical protein
MRYSWFDLVGNAGVVILIVTYLLLQLKRLDAHRFAYSALNALGAGMIALSLLFSFNVSAFIIEIFWVAIDLFGIYRYLRAANESIK